MNERSLEVSVQLYTVCATLAKASGDYHIFDESNGYGSVCGDVEFENTALAQHNKCRQDCVVRERVYDSYAAFVKDKPWKWCF